jgi:CIC family chloride channel protein
MQTDAGEEGGSGTPGGVEVTPEILRGEIADFIRSHEQRRRLVPRAVLAGVVAGLVAVAFRLSLVGAEDLRDRLIAVAHAFGLAGILLPVLWGAVGAGLAVFVVRRYAPAASGSGIPQVKAVLHHLRGMRWRRILPVKFVGGVVGIAGGMALGREGPTIQMGAAIGDQLSRWWGSTPRERQTLIAATAGAGLAAAFNAPLAGVVFVLEELQRDFSPGVFTATFFASFAADVTARVLTNQLPVFHVTITEAPPLTALPFFAVVGLAAGLLGVAFNRALVLSLDLFGRFPKRPSWLGGALVGAALGAVGFFYPQVLGGGHVMTDQVLAGRTPLEWIPLLFLVRFFMTMGSYGTGAPGGIFAPLLVLGSHLGLAIGQVGARIAPGWTGSPQAFAAVGMGAYFTAIVRAPLTGIVLIIEMTGAYSVILPLLVACLAAYALADALGDRPVYEALLERDLLRSRGGPELEETLLLELPVQPGAPFEGREVRQLGLPAGCVLITVRRGLEDEVPTASTRLHAGDRITAVISPKAGHAVTLLREGTEPAD